MSNQIIEKFKEKTKIDCYRAKLLEEKPSILDDKIGGIPYLPVGEEYPKDENGNDLALLIQVNLKNIDLENYPKKGVLEIFIDKEVDYPCKYQIRYFEEGLEYQENIPQVDLTQFVVDKPIKIEFEKSVDYMPIADYRFEDTMKEVIEEVTGKELTDLDEIQELLEDNEKDFDYINDNYISVGGYANFTQTDPRTYEKKDMTDCLIKIDSYIDLRKICVGDAGIIFVLIKPEDIKDCKFENAFVDWDCS